jgi:F0F1-type ATP synthase membrane subunit b/b'
MTLEEAIESIKKLDKYFQHIEAEYKRKTEEIHAKAKEKVESSQAAETNTGRA